MINFQLSFKWLLVWHNKSTALLVQEHGFSLHKTACSCFTTWLAALLLTALVVQPSLLIKLCLVRRVDFHQYATMRYLTAEPLTEMCHNVEVEPHFQPLNGKTF